jgi:hypothetical protein
MTDKETAMRKCDECLTPYTDEDKLCPGCGKKLPGYDIENPYSMLPMEHILRVVGHLVWIVGVVGFVIILWNTDQQNDNLNWLIAAGGFIFLAFSIVISIALFCMSEILRRVIRIQRRVRAFVEEYKEQL